MASPSPVSEKAQESTKASIPGPKLGGPVKPWVPTLVNLILMPLIAFAVTKFYLIPELNSKSKSKVEVEDTDKETSAKKDSGGSDGPKKSDNPSVDTDSPYIASISKPLTVNVSGTMATRYLVANFSLVGNPKALKKKHDKIKLEEKKPSEPKEGEKKFDSLISFWTNAVALKDSKLRDGVSGVLSGKTVVDIEAAGFRNLIKLEILAICQDIMKDNLVQEVLITDLAVQ